MTRIIFVKIQDEFWIQFYVNDDYFCLKKRPSGMQLGKFTFYCLGIICIYEIFCPYDEGPLLWKRHRRHIMFTSKTVLLNDAIDDGYLVLWKWPQSNAQKHTRLSRQHEKCSYMGLEFPNVGMHVCTTIIFDDSMGLHLLTNTDWTR